MTVPRAFVIGHPIAHSRSPLLHGFWLREHGLAGSYEKVDVAPDELPRFVAALGAGAFVGGNVTVPHKASMMSLVDEVDDAARAIGAVNTLWFDGKCLVGGNTDATGFVASLDAEAPGWDHTRRSALVLGAGGAARAVVHGLLGRGFAIGLVNRTAAAAETIARDFGPAVTARTWTDLPGLLRTCDMLVNTTSLGMVGKPALTIELDALHPGALVCDIVYVPLDTPLLAEARRRGHPTIGGLGMLLHQAVPGFASWFGLTPAVTPALRAILEADVRAAGG